MQTPRASPTLRNAESHRRLQSPPISAAATQQSAGLHENSGHIFLQIRMLSLNRVYRHRHQPMASGKANIPPKSWLNNVPPPRRPDITCPSRRVPAAWSAPPHTPPSAPRGWAVAARHRWTRRRWCGVWGRRGPTAINGSRRLNLLSQLGHQQLRHFIHKCLGTSGCHDQNT